MTGEIYSFATCDYVLENDHFLIQIGQTATANENVGKKQTQLGNFVKISV